MVRQCGERQLLDNDQSWTASRCLRIIRSIQTRVSVLQRLAQDARRESGLGSARSASCDGAAVSLKRRLHDCTLSSHQQPPLKRARQQTYARRDRAGSRQQEQQMEPCRRQSLPPDKHHQQQKYQHSPRHQQQQQQQQQQRHQRQRQDDRDDAKMIGRHAVPSTPLLRRVLSMSPHRCSDEQKLQQPGISTVEYSHTSSATATSLDMRSLRGEIPAGHQGTYEAIAAWLRSLLRQTCVASGTKSLMAMTLRRLAGYLDELDVEEQEEASRQGLGLASGHTLPSIRIYSELEEFGSLGGNGWPPLSVLVRAHGMSILERAVLGGLMHGGFVRMLAQICVEFGAIMEGTRLLQVAARMPETDALVHEGAGRDATTGGQDNEAVSFERLASLATTEASAKRTSAAAIAYWRIGGMLNSHSGDVGLGHDTATRSDEAVRSAVRLAEKEVWRSIVVDMACEPSAARFARDLSMTMLSLLARQSRQVPSAGHVQTQNGRAAERAMLDTLAVLYAVAQARGALPGTDRAIAGGLAQIVVSLTPPSANKQFWRMNWVPGRYMTAIVLLLLARASQKRGLQSTDTESALLRSWQDLDRLAASVVLHHIEQEEAGVVQLRALRESSGRRRHRYPTKADATVAGSCADGTYWTAVRVVSSVAHFCKRLSTAGSEAGWQVSTLSQPLADLSLGSSDSKSDSSAAARPFATLRQDCAFFFASLTNDQRDFATAEAIKAETKLAARLIQGKENVPPPQGASQWRWEEGLNEWVIARPMAATTAKVWCNDATKTTAAMASNCASRRPLSRLQQSMQNR